VPKPVDTVDYITLAELKSTLTLTGQNYADADLQLAITAASRAIDHRTGRIFSSEQNAADWKFTALSSRVLLTPDFYQLVSVSWGGVTYTEDEDFYLTPTDGPPWNIIQALKARFPTEPLGVTVNAKWGFDTVPAEIKEATKILAARLARRPREAAFGIAGLGIDSTAVYVSRVDPEVDLMLKPYIRQPLLG